MSTARTVLRLLTLLAQDPAGLRADEIAQRLGKSTSTAYNLLDTLCREGFVVHGEDGTYRLTADASALVPAAPSNGRLPTSLEGILDELFERTHKRVYLAAAQSGNVVIPLARGRQGMPRIPGLGARIGENAHALALGKIALSLLDERGLDRYIGRGLRAFTPFTIVDGRACAPSSTRSARPTSRSTSRSSARTSAAWPCPCATCAGRPSRRSACRCRRAASSSSATRSPRRCARSRLRASAALGPETPAVPAIPEDPPFLSHAGGRT